jgi:hypothetical protein
MIDCIYVAASRYDTRFTPICVSSIRRFYPDATIRLIVGGTLRPGLAQELATYYDVSIADFPRGDYGWGFAKLEPLFKPPGERFLMLDSDTAFTGPVLDRWSELQSPFMVDDEEYPPDVIPTRYYDWQKVRKIDPKAQPPAFVFNSGQWIGSSGVLSREEFDPWVEWTFPRRLKHPEVFFPGDQGVFNYVLVQKAMLEGLPVERRAMMHWPGYGMGGLTAESIRAGSAAPVIIHWAGLKVPRISRMTGGDILTDYEDEYYGRLPLGELHRRLALTYAALANIWRWAWVRVSLTIRKLSF